MCVISVRKLMGEKGRRLEPFITNRRGTVTTTVSLADQQKAKSTIDYFAASQSCERGFPSKPACLAFDEVLRLIAVGTRNGDIRICGNPGFQVSAQSEGSIQSLEFLNDGQGRLLCLLESGRIEIWELNNVDGAGVSLDLILKSPDELTCHLERFTAHALLGNGAIVAIGTHCGNVILVILNEMRISEDVINKADVQISIPEQYKTKTGVVEAICPHPTAINRLLIGYTKGLLVLWNIDTQSLEKMYLYNQQIESLCWYGFDDVHFASSHSDGSYILWQINNESNPQSQNRMPYGPFPCRAINKILVKVLRNEEVLVIFAGGLPRSAFPDKSCVSISIFESDNYVSEKVAFDLPSRFVDMLIVDRNTVCDKQSKGYDEPAMLLILTEEELLAVDLLSKSWSLLRLPYLNTVQFASITVILVSQISSTLVEQLQIISTDITDIYSDFDWPNLGGSYLSRSSRDETKRDILFTGHEDGSVCFWDITQADFPMVCRLMTIHYFNLQYESHSEEHEDNWPPFQKIGMFDPCVDDSRLSIQQIYVEKEGFLLALANALGYIFIFEISTLRSVTRHVESPFVALDPFIVKFTDQAFNPGKELAGTQSLTIKKKLKYLCGYCPLALVQIVPISKISVICTVDKFSLLAVGCSFGFFIFDYIQFKVILLKTTINVEDIPCLVTDPQLTRGRFLKKSLRESIRKLRRSKLQASFHLSTTTNRDLLANNGPIVTVVKTADNILPVERQVEAREFNNAVNNQRSAVRCIYTSHDHISTIASTSDLSVLFGTNNGSIFAYTVQMPSLQTRHSVPLSATMVKEIHLRHKAAIIGIGLSHSNGLCISYSNNPSFNSTMNDKGSEVGSAATMSNCNSINSQTPHLPSNYKLVICSEEQLKVFSLPQLRQFCKYKITGTEGSLVRKVFFTAFKSKSDPVHNQPCVICLTNTGDICVFALPYLRRLTTINCTKPQNIMGINFFCYSVENNRALVMTSYREFREITCSSVDSAFKQDMCIETLNINNRIDLVKHCSLYACSNSDIAEVKDTNAQSCNEDDTSCHTTTTTSELKRMQLNDNNNDTDNDNIDNIENHNENHSNVVTLAVAGVTGTTSNTYLNCHDPYHPPISEFRTTASMATATSSIVTTNSIINDNMALLRIPTSQATIQSRIHNGDLPNSNQLHQYQQLRYLQRNEL
ncbi:hypothetical protein GJ496_011091 [Pomphorhynchus laevis]|nr:hypothetical protein GJ496_011091 [Pomphorhynchus laevis]